ncbi:putative myb DNA-binding domain protein [Rosellinia necatrix]|uniref:Putative myb DNA-binding domain protein n=1 Tax=Rosellinia necatrix TaxID=77044 RepID=A0A1W2TS69_ROSNE|nr:putative myb DNA-binding domain protein [Rosellinia necatrix]
MSTRQTRASSRRADSLEPQQSLAPRQTRNGSKRAEAQAGSPPSKLAHHLEIAIPRRGTRRGRRRSLESVATNDYPKSLVEYPSPERSLLPIPEFTSADDLAGGNVESQNDSYEDRMARLQDLLDFDLPKLCRWCETAYKALCFLTEPEPTAEERRSLNTARKAFKLACRPLAEDGAAYIDLSSSDLPYREDPSAHNAIRKAVCSANLISLLLSLVDLKRQQQATLPFLQELDDAFPNCIGSIRSLELETHKLAFLVRCRRLIELLGDEQETAPLVLATQIFCTQAAGTSEEATLQLQAGPFRKLGGTEQDGDFTSSDGFKMQMDKIITELASTPAARAHKVLNEAFPRDELLTELRAWALDSYVRVNEEADETLPSSNDHNEGAVNDSADQKGLEFDESGDYSDLESGTQPDEYHQLKTIAREPSYIVDTAALAAVRRIEKGGPRRPIAELPPQPWPAKGKLTASQMRFRVLQLDPADILGPSSSVDGSSSEKLGTMGKHTQEDEDYRPDDDDDDDFEVSEQLINESRRVYHDHPEASKPVPKRHRRVGNSGDASGRVRSPDSASASSDRNRGNVAVISQAARGNRLVNKPRGHQIRERWSNADTERLLRFIADEDISCSWAVMEREGKEKGGFQTNRNQQAIRDKARNLKKGYLCADAALPKGFDYVYLSKKERDDVIAAGRNPDRMEDDIDAHGRVIRNRWEASPN